MKRTAIAIILASTVLATWAQKPVLPSDVSIEKKIERQLSRMSLDEKIGQMVELEIGMITFRDPRYSAEALAEMDEVQLAETIEKFGLDKLYHASELVLKTSEER